MFAGVGIVGALAGILSSLLVQPPTPPEPNTADAELTAIRGELAALRSFLEQQQQQQPPR
jgi:hypothetical protein